MDIDAMQTQLTELIAWKRRVEPMLASSLAEFEERNPPVTVGAIFVHPLIGDASNQQVRIVSAAEVTRMQEEQRAMELHREQALQPRPVPVTMANPAPTEPGVGADLAALRASLPLPVQSLSETLPVQASPGGPVTPTTAPTPTPTPASVVPTPSPLPVAGSILDPSTAPLRSMT